MKQTGKPPVPSDNTPRPASNENYLLISAFSAASQSLLVAISKRISECGCTLAEARVSTLGTELSVPAHAQGAWYSLANTENVLTKLYRGCTLCLTNFPTSYRNPPTNFTS